MTTTGRRPRAAPDRSPDRGRARPLDQRRLVHQLPVDVERRRDRRLPLRVERAGEVPPRRHAQLRALAQGDVLAVRRPPDVGQLVDVEVHTGHGAVVDVPVRHPTGPAGVDGPDDVHDDVVDVADDAGEERHDHEAAAEPAGEHVEVGEVAEGRGHQPAVQRHRQVPGLERGRAAEVGALPARGGGVHGVQRHRRAQLRVLAGAVVALEVVLEEDLPVGPHLVGLAEGQREAFGPGGEHVGAEEVERGAQRRGRGLTERDEEEPVPALEVGRDETPLRVVEELAVGRSGHVAQAAVGPVAPAVVRAGEAGRVPLRLLAEAVAAVPADVEEGVDLTRAIAHDDDALARDLVHEEVAGSGQLGLVGDERPLPEEHPLDLGLERGR